MGLIQKIKSPIIKYSMNKTNHERLVKEWLITDAEEILKRCKKDLTYEEIVLLLSDSLGDIFLDIIDHKEIDIDNLPKRKKAKGRITQREL